MTQETAISELCDIIAGQHIAASLYSDVPDGTPYLTGPSDFGDREPVVSKWTNSPKVFAKEGDVLVTVKGSGVGKLNLGCDAAIGRQLMALRPKIGKITQSYLFGFLRFVEPRVHKMAQGAAIPGITKNDIASLRLYAPPLAEQKRIAGILDAADALRAKRRESLAQLDTLLQSTFLDMFGDPVTNPMGWELRTLDEMGEVQTGSTPPSKLEGMFGGDIPFVTPGDLRETWVKSKRTVTEAGAGKSRTVKRGATLVCCIGATIGKMGKASDRSAFNQQINAVSWGEEVIDDFGLELMRFLKARIATAGASTTLPILKKSLFQRISVPVPPLGEQRRFAAVVESVEQQKTSQRAHLDELDTLFASLQSRAFRGDL